MDTLVTRPIAPQPAATPFYYLKKALKPAFHGAINLNVALSGDKYRYVFVLAHMRSGSTLLSHILASNPKFAHAGKSYVRYRSSKDFKKLIVETCRRLHKIRLRATYVVDQINWSVCLTNEIFELPLIEKCVILIREPEATLKSCMVTAAAPGLPGMQEKEALDYYINRLAELSQYGTVLGKRALLVEYDNLVDRPEKTLATLTAFFGVDQAFSVNYRTHRMTGQDGDPSKNIQLGRIIRTQSHDVDISPDVLSRARMAFENCRRHLLNAGVQFAG